MILNIGSFTRRVVIVECVCPAEPEGQGGTKHGRSIGCKTRIEAVEDRELMQCPLEVRAGKWNIEVLNITHKNT